MTFIMLIVGFIFLIKGADIFVEGTSSIAKKFKVPSMVIGLTIVAMGTSAPEAAVSITSSLAGQNDMSIANVVGSNFFNILMVLGVSSIMATLPVEKSTIKKDTPFLIAISIILLIFSIDLHISRIEGLLLLVLFAYFLMDTIKIAKKSNVEDIGDFGESAIDIDGSIVKDIDNQASINIVKTIFLSLIGMICIIFGGDLVVDSATSIAKDFGMSSNLIGLTVVAMGTSLPEFVTSIVAVKKGETDIAIGNVIGSNIFNILLVLGLAMSINPISVSLISAIDIIFMVFITIILYLFMKKNNSLIKSQGFILVCLYFIYIIYTIIR